MHRYYLDILDKIKEKPQWFDEHAIPRFCEFTPREIADIYADECVLLLIECQSCKKKFKVALSDNKISWFKFYVKERDGEYPVMMSERIESLHYGDPPNINCCPAGPTMNSVPIRVLEFWKKTKRLRKWERISELEIEIDCEWA